MYEIRLLDKSLAKTLIRLNHYTKSAGRVKFALGAYRNNLLVGIGTFCNPTAPSMATSISPILHHSEVVELMRFWVSQSQGKNSESKILSLMIKRLKSHYNYKVLVTYADPYANHVGTIYQATNFLYQGTKTMKGNNFLHCINNERLHQRSCVHKYGTTRKDVLTKIDSNYHRIKLPKKHRYFLILCKRSKRRILKTLKHNLVNYPKK
tara:strand:+ start:126 stop:749 length:624 start_codon:yes stop_codon:yes gene_type:complete